MIAYYPRSTTFDIVQLRLHEHRRCSCNRREFRNIHSTCSTYPTMNQSSRVIVGATLCGLFLALAVSSSSGQKDLKEVATEVQDRSPVDLVLTKDEQWLITGQSDFQFCFARRDQNRQGGVRGPLRRTAVGAGADARWQDRAVTRHLFGRADVCSSLAKGKLSRSGQGVPELLRAARRRASRRTASWPTWP